jgi:hypothetical protein
MNLNWNASATSCRFHLFRVNINQRFSDREMNKTPNRSRVAEYSGMFPGADLSDPLVQTVPKADECFWSDSGIGRIHYGGDEYAADIYHLGKVLRERFIQVRAIL